MSLAIILICCFLSGASGFPSSVALHDTLGLARLRRQQYGFPQPTQQQSQYEQSPRLSPDILPPWPGPDSSYQSATAVQPQQQVVSSPYGQTPIIASTAAYVPPTPREPVIVGHYYARDDIPPASRYGRWWNWTYLRWNAPIYTVLEG